MLPWCAIQFLQGEEAPHLSESLERVAPMPLHLFKYMVLCDAEFTVHAMISDDSLDH